LFQLVAVGGQLYGWRSTKKDLIFPQSRTMGEVELIKLLEVWELLQVVCRGTALAGCFVEQRAFVGYFLKDEFCGLFCKVRLSRGLFTVHYENKQKMQNEQNCGEQNRQ
jgi:hypothetical protein